jgi:hypothetical protein
MPKSKTRKPARRPDSQPIPRVTPANALEIATLSLVQASFEIVREAELHITAAARAGEGVEEALAIHHELRSGSLGLLVAYSKMAGLPDPRDGRE